MKRKINTAVGQPVRQAKDIPGGGIALKCFTLCGGLLLMALLLWITDTFFNYGGASAGASLFSGIGYLKDTLLWVLFFAGIFFGCVGGIVCLFIRGPLYRLDPPSAAKPFDMVLLIDADGIGISYGEPVTVYRTPWSKAEQIAEYRCRFSWDTVEEARVESGKKVAPFGYLFIRGKSEFTRSVSGTVEKLNSLAYRSKFNSPVNSLYIWLEPPLIPAINQELTKYRKDKEDEEEPWRKEK